MREFDLIKVSSVLPGDMLDLANDPHADPEGANASFYGYREGSALDYRCEELSIVEGDSK